MNDSEVAKIEHDLTENGLAFLRRSVEEMDGDAEGDGAPFALVHLAVAVEVLLKARLIREGWKLICIPAGRPRGERESRPGHASSKSVKTEAQVEAELEARLISGSAKTVGPDRAIELLNVHAGLDLESCGHAERVREIARLRNRAVHFTLRQGGQLDYAVPAAYGRGLDFVLWLLGGEFRGSVGGETEALVEDVIEELTTEVGKLEALVKERTASIEASIDGVDACLECPRCRQPALVLSSGERAHCAFCLWSPIDGDTSAYEYVEDVLELSRYKTTVDGGEWPIHHCPSCGQLALVEGIVLRREQPEHDSGFLQCDGVAIPHWGCFHCGMTAGFIEIERCSRCDVVTETGADGAPICGDCFAEYAESY